MQVERYKNNRSLFRFILIPFQFRFVVLIAGTAILATGIFYGILFFYIRENYQLLVEVSPMTEEVKGVLSTEVRELSLIALGVSLLFTVISSLWGIIYSHRMVGPIVNMTQVIRAYREGQVHARIQLRSRDEFKPLAEEINQLLQHLHPSNLDSMKQSRNKT